MQRTLTYLSFDIDDADEVHQEDLNLVSHEDASIWCAIETEDGQYLMKHVDYDLFLSLKSDSSSQLSITPTADDDGRYLNVAKWSVEEKEGKIFHVVSAAEEKPCLSKLMRGKMYIQPCSPSGGGNRLLFIENMIESTVPVSITDIKVMCYF